MGVEKKRKWIHLVKVTIFSNIFFINDLPLELLLLHVIFIWFPVKWNGHRKCIKKINPPCLGNRSLSQILCWSSLWFAFDSHRAVNTFFCLSSTMIYFSYIRLRFQNQGSNSNVRGKKTWPASSPYSIIFISSKLTMYTSSVLIKYQLRKQA